MSRVVLFPSLAVCCCSEKRYIEYDTLKAVLLRVIREIKKPVDERHVTAYYKFQISCFFTPHEEIFTPHEEFSTVHFKTLRAV